MSQTMSAASAQAAGESSSDPSASSSQSRLPRHEQKKRRQVTVACNECRKRKVKCDGLRPSCSPCHARDLTCFYEADPDATPIVALKRKFDQLQRQAQDSEEVLEMLRSRPEQEAIAILQRIRSSDLTSALAMIRDGDLLMPQHLQMPRASHNALPPLHSLMTNGPESRHWPSKTGLHTMEKTLPDPLSALERSESRRSDKGRFDPKFQRSASLSSVVDYEDEPRTTSATTHHGGHGRPWSPKRRLLIEDQPLYDARLQGVRASQWTSVYIEDSVFAKIISTYMTWDHPPWRLFDEDMFIDDLVAGRATHCSKLLVNAILAYGCQNYAAIDPAREALGSFFFVEAKQLWHLEEGTESLACIAASGLLHGLHSCRGKDKVGLTYLVQGVRMAKDMGLFRKKTANEVYDTSQPQLSKGRAAVAWGLFSYVVSHSMYMHKDSLLKTPPPVAIPECPVTTPTTPTASLNDAWHVTQTFKASCELWVIVKDFLPLYYNGDEPEDIDTRGLMGSIIRIHERLLTWVDTLPSALKSGPEALPHVINLHMQLHCVVAELFRPFVGEMPQSDSSMAASFPMDAAIASMEQLRSLVYQYVSRYNGPPVSVSMLGSLLCVTYAAIRRLNNSEWRFFFAVCIRFLGEMVDYFPVARFVLQGIYHSAERTHTAMPPEALSVFDYYNGLINQVRISEVESSLPIDLNLSQTDLEGARLSNLIKGTGEITLEDA